MLSTFRLAFERDKGSITHFAQPKQAATGSESADGIVEDRIRFEDPRSGHFESKGIESLFNPLRVLYAELNLISVYPEQPLTLLLGGADAALQAKIRSSPHRDQPIWQTTELASATIAEPLLSRIISASIMWAMV